MPETSARTTCDHDHTQDEVTATFMKLTAILTGVLRDGHVLRLLRHAACFIRLPRSRAFRRRLRQRVFFFLGTS